MIVDGADNFPTRYLLNDASIPQRHPRRARLDLPLRGADGLQAEGRACYRCLFPQPPPPELAPSCAEGGVLGVPLGIIGLLQANEALKSSSASATCSSAGCFSSTRSRPSSPGSRSAATLSARSAASSRRSPSTSITSSFARAGRARGSRGSASGFRPRSAARRGAREVEASGRHASRRPGRPRRALSGTRAAGARRRRRARALRERLCHQRGRAQLQGLETPVGEGATVILLPAMAGGERIADPAARHDRIDPARRAAAARAQRERAHHAKLEGQNPTGSPGDRVAKAMVEAARSLVELSPAASCSSRRAATPASPRDGREAQGATPHLRPAGERNAGARAHARALRRELRVLARARGLERRRAACPSHRRGRPRYFMLNQYANEANPRAHYEGTGADRGASPSTPSSPVSEPAAPPWAPGSACESPSRTSSSQRRSRFQGDLVYGLRSLADGYVPPILDVSRLDRKVLVSNEESVAGLRPLLDREGIFAGVSSGAVVHVARRLAEELDEGTSSACSPTAAGSTCPPTSGTRRCTKPALDGGQLWW